MTMVATVIFCVLTVGFFAALGRSATPRAERRPWWRWTWRDWIANVARGGRSLHELNQRQRDLWDSNLGGLQSRRRPPDEDEEDDDRGGAPR